MLDYGLALDADNVLNALHRNRLHAAALMVASRAQAGTSQVRNFGKSQQFACLGDIDIQFEM